MATIADWTAVRWTEAGQVVALMGADAPLAPEQAVPPAAFHADLVAQHRLEEALMFLGHALGRLEAVGWAARVLREEAESQVLPRADRQALDHALRWLDEPSDAHRRAAERAGQAAAPRSPERALASAVFLSGGSISEPELPPVLAPPALAGRYAAIAIRLAAQRPGRADAVQARALELGARVAQGGLDALSLSTSSAVA